MPEAFKNNFNPDNIAYLADLLGTVLPEFDEEGFKQAATHNLEALELKARSLQITAALHRFMPEDVEKSLHAIEKILAPVKREEIQWQADESGICGWIVMPVCDYAAQITLDEVIVDEMIVDSHFDKGLQFQSVLTRRFSAEFSIRKFILRDPTRALTTMLDWTSSPCAHVRRLSSEGCRPRLPWGVRLDVIVANPAPVFPILTALLDDDSEYVRRSVANNLNDIAKDHPDQVVEFVNQHWDQHNQQRTRMFKHALRSLIKAGHPAALKALGVGEFNGTVSTLTTDKNAVNMGENVTFELTLKATVAQQCIVDYVVYYRKQNGALSPKVFKWKNLSLARGEQVTLKKTHIFKPVTTRVHYAGEHQIAAKVNGRLFPAKTIKLAL